jgi:preprotein translocase subunit SecG
MRRLALLWSVTGLVCLGGVTLVLLGDSERASCFNPGGTASQTSTCSRYGPTLVAGRIFVLLGIALLLVAFVIFWTRRSAASAAGETQVEK